MSPVLLFPISDDSVFGKNRWSVLVNHHPSPQRVPPLVLREQAGKMRTDPLEHLAVDAKRDPMRANQKIL